MSSRLACGWRDALVRASSKSVTGHHLALSGSGTRSAFSGACDVGMPRKISRCRPPASGPPHRPR